ncbi:alpha/beta hydrolase fold domain-containing protein [Cupriavidus basilensis]
MAAAIFFCSPRTHRLLDHHWPRHACAGLACVPDYRLAPEHPFQQAPVRSMRLHVSHRLLAQGVAPSRIVVAGDFSGGGLALALLVALRDAADPLPAGAVLYSPDGPGRHRPEPDRQRCN